MSHISIGAAVGSGFGLIGRKPLSVLVWGLVPIMFGAASFAIFGPLFLGMVGPMMQAAQNAQASGGSPSEAINQTIATQMGALNGVSYLIQIVSLFVNAILYCAVSRAIVHPERRAFAYLRLGAPEFFVAVITFGAGFVVAIAIFICAIPITIAVVVLAMNKMTAAAIIVGGLGAVVLLAVALYALLRFAFVIPMMVDDGKFHLFDAWSLTKNHAGALLAIGLCLMLIGLVGEVVAVAIFFVIGVGGLSLSAGGLQNLQAFFALPPMTILGRLGPWLAGLGLLAIPLEGCALAIFMAPWARAYRDVAPPAPPAAALVPPPPAPLPPAQPIQPAPTPA